MKTVFFLFFFLANALGLTALEPTKIELILKKLNNLSNDPSSNEKKFQLASEQLTEIVREALEKAHIPWTDYIIIESLHNQIIQATATTIALDGETVVENLIIVRTTDTSLSAQDKEKIVFGLYFGYALGLHPQKTFLFLGIGILKLFSYISFTLLSFNHILITFDLNPLIPATFLISTGVFIPMGIIIAIFNIPELDYYMFPDASLWALDQITKHYGPHFLMEKIDDFFSDKKACWYNPEYYLRPHREIMGDTLLKAFHHANLP